MDSHSFGSDPKDSPSPSHHHNDDDPEGGWANITGGAYSLRPPKAIAGPLGSSILPTVLHRGPPVPCSIHQLALPAESFRYVNLKGFGKMCICKECDRTSSNWDNMVSHYLQEHLSICLACPHHGMSYLDPSKFWCHRRETHNLLFQ